MWAGNFTLRRLYFMFASTFFTVMPILMQNKSLKNISNLNVLIGKIAGSDNSAIILSCLQNAIYGDSSTATTLYYQMQN